MKDKEKNKKLIKNINDFYNEMLHELEAIDDSFEKFQGNNVYNKAIKLDLIQIAEFYNHLSEDIQILIPGKDLSGLINVRNVLVHGYTTTEDDQVWDAVHNDVPRIVQTLNSVTR